jgi:hypothetical protein
MSTHPVDIGTLLKEVEKATELLDIVLVFRIDHTRGELREVMCIVFPVDFDSLWKEEKVECTIG